MGKSIIKNASLFGKICNVECEDGKIVSVNEEKGLIGYDADGRTVIPGIIGMIADESNLVIETPGDGVIVGMPPMAVPIVVVGPVETLLDDLLRRARLYSGRIIRSGSALIVVRLNHEGEVFFGYVDAGNLVVIANSNLHGVPLSAWASQRGTHRNPVSDAPSPTGMAQNGRSKARWVHRMPWSSHAALDSVCIPPPYAHLRL